MTELLFRKVVNERGMMGLIPSDEAAVEWLQKTKDGQQVLMTGRRARNMKQHRKFFALLNIVMENQEHFDSLEHLKADVKVGAGHCWVYPMADGSTMFVPRPMDCASMSQDEFEPFYDRALVYICSKVIPGMVREDLQLEIIQRIAA